MLEMPKYWNSTYYNRETNTLADNAPKYLQDEWEQYNRVDSIDKDNYTML